jgi:periplasmic protein TonB
MFEGALLDSSPSRVPVLGRIHYFVSAFAGLIFFTLGWHTLPWCLGSVPAHILFMAAAVAAGVAALDALMISYVWADAARRRMRAGLWVAITTLFSLPGFVVYLIYTARRSGDWKRATMPLAYAVNAAVVGILILVPLIRTEALPDQITQIHIPSPPAPPAAPVPAHVDASPRRPEANLLTTPARIPATIGRIIDEPEPPPSVGGFGVAGSIPGGIPDGVIGSVGQAMPPPLPPPPPAPRPSPPATVRIGSGVIAAQAIYQPQPVYPPLARMARIQGTVVLEAIIATDGSIKDLKVAKGHPLLIGAAIEAVKTWRYRPTLLNGEPVEVITEIDVNFNLAE